MVKNRFSIKIENKTAEIGTAAELAVALDVLQGHHDRMVLEQLRPHLNKIVRTSQDLYALLKVLTLDDKIFLIDSLGSKIVNIIGAPGHLRDILATLSEHDAEEKLLQTLGSKGLQTIIHSAEDLSEILQWVYGICDQLVLQLIGEDYLKHLIQTGYELSLVLYTLDLDRQKELIELLGWEKVVLMIKDRRDLAHLLRAMPDEISKKLLKQFTKEQLWQIIRDEYGWRQVYKYLAAEEAVYLERILGVKHAK